MASKEKLSLLPVSSEEGSIKPAALKVASVYETQSESEIFALGSEASKNEPIVEQEKSPEKKVSPPSTKMSVRSKRREKRLRNEPPNITGGEDGPSGVHVLDFVEARATELKNMTHALEHKQMGKLTSQKLPRHMRRRAASHNVKRLPRRCREAAAREMEKSKADGSVDKSKQSRKHKRNTRNLQSAEAQRERDSKWLQTHLWHAKRMKMTEKYGYKLSEHRSDKGVRAAYKSLTHGCLISDVSYYGCVEVTGLQDEIVKCLAPLFNSETGLTIAGKAFLGGAREGATVLYRRGEYPRGAIGPVQFLWRAQPPDVADPIVVANSKSTSLWVWCHPAMHAEVLSEVHNCVEASNADKTEGDLSVSAANSENELISVRDVCGDLTRFRLIGPRSHALLMEVLKPEFDPERAGESEPGSDSIEIDPLIVTESNEPRWWRGANQNSFYEHCRLLSKLHDTIKAAPTPGHFQKGTVLSMTALDPRLTTPTHSSNVVFKYYPLGKHEQVTVEESSPDNTESTCQGETLTSLQSLPVGVAYSLLWNSYVRAVVSNSKKPTHEINHLRSQQLVRSSTLNLGQKASKIPVVLVQQTMNCASRRTYSGSKALSCGWDVILPSEWSREFWLAIVYCGARVSGLNELQKCSLELQSPHFPDDFPDTASCQTHCKEVKKQLMEQYERFPPSKRRNYGKFSIASPFEYLWREIVTTWCQESRLNRFCCYSSPLPPKRIKLETDPDQDLKECCQDMDSSVLDVYVIRSVEVLTVLSQFVEQLFSKKYKKHSHVDLSDLESSFKTTLRDHSIDEYLKVHRSALLGVKLQMYRRGTLSAHNAISVPAVSDFVPLLSFCDLQPQSGPKEEVHPKGLTVVEEDALIIGISSLSAKQIAEVKEKRKIVKKSLKRIKIKEGENVPALPLQKAAKEEYHLHPVQPMRETFGYVTSAGYRHTTSLYSGRGFCTFAGFLEMVCKGYLAPGVCEPLALVRGNSTQYWFVKIELL